MGTTPKYAIPYVEPADALANYPTQDKAQADAVEAAIELAPVWCEATNPNSPQCVNNVTLDVTFTAVTQEPAGQWTSGATVKIVAAGVYQVTYAASWANNGTGTRTVQLKVNGVSTRTAAVPVTQGNGLAGGSFTIIRRFALNDTVGLGVWQNSGATLAASTQPSPTLTLLRLGA